MPLLSTYDPDPQTQAKYDSAQPLCRTANNFKYLKAICYRIAVLNLHSINYDYPKSKSRYNQLHSER